MSLGENTRLVTIVVGTNSDYEVLMLTLATLYKTIYSLIFSKMFHIILPLNCRSYKYKP